jgi:hypothetical protein
MSFHEDITKEVAGEEKMLRLEVGARRVHLPGRTEKLSLVVVRRFGREPMMLLTNLKLTRSRKSIWHIVAAYMTRWRIEETFRFMTQSYQPEDVRVGKSWQIRFIDFPAISRYNSSSFFRFVRSQRGWRRELGLSIPLKTAC